MAAFDTSKLDHYQTLGIRRDASDEDIRKAYKRLAVQWHPDKNSSDKAHAEVMFKRIGEAYCVLSDAKRRADYDGSTGGKRAFNFGDLDDAFTIFRDFFGGSDPFAGFDDMFDSAFKGFDAAVFGNFFDVSTPSPVKTGASTTDAMKTPKRGARAHNRSAAANLSSPHSPAESSVTTTSTKTTTNVINGRRVVTTESKLRTPDGKTKTTKRKEPQEGGSNPDTSGASPAKKGKQGKTGSSQVRKSAATCETLALVGAERSLPCSH